VFSKQVSDLMKKVYLISIEAGGGHRSTVNALQKLIAQQQLPWEIHVVEFFKEIVGTSNPQNTYNNLILKNKWLRFIYEPILSPLFSRTLIKCFMKVCNQCYQVFLSLRF
jgi:hypothetical protein